MTQTTNPSFYRWCDAMRQRVPQMPEEFLTLYYEALEAGSSVSVDAIATALHCDAEEAAYWQATGSVWLFAPRLYAPLFAAEDDMADCRSKRTAYMLSVKATEEMLTRLDQEICTRKTYALLSEAHAAEQDHEREVTLRHQARDLPAMQQMLEAEERAVLERLQRGQAAIDEAFSQQVDAVQAQWTQEALERCEPILEVLRRARSIDDAAKALGRQGSLSGSQAVAHAVFDRLRGQR
jgi:hypothetical protein